MKFKGVILAGGTGSRLSPLTKVTNKHLLPVYDKPMIYYPIKTLVDSGIKDITIVLGGESVGDFIKLLGDGEEFGAHLNYVHQSKPGGIAEALYLARKIVEGCKIAVILGDNIFEDSFKGIFSLFYEADYMHSCIFLKEVKDPERFGVAVLNETGIVKEIEEKPENPKSNLAVTGLYLYDEDVFKVIEIVKKEIGYSSRGELEITDVNNYYLRFGLVNPQIVKGFWSDAGTFNTLLKSSNFIKEKRK